MKTRELLIASASLLAAAGGAKAADPVVVIEPVAANYVEICDAFGSGFFYIPGTETCLSFDGYVRFEVDAGGIQTGGPLDADWTTLTKTVFEVWAKTDTELGTLTSVIAPEIELYSNGSSSITLDDVYLNLGDDVYVRAGYFKSFWDQDLYGELDNIDNTTKYNSIRLGVHVDHFEAALQIDALDPSEAGAGGFPAGSNKLALSGRLGYVVSDSQYLKLDAAYDSYNENYAIRPWAGFGIGPGTFEIAGLYESGFISYAPDFTAANWDDSPIAGTYLKYAVAANYYFNVTDKLILAPQTQYNVASNDKAFWEAGAVADWEIVDNFHARLNANYAFIDDDWNQQNWFGWFRLERDF